MTITMRTTTRTAQPTSTASRRRGTRAAAIGGAVVAASALFLAGRAAGTDFTVSGSGSGESDPFTLAQISGFTLQCGLLGWGALAVLERFTRRARAIWNTMAAVVLALSLVPIWLVQATTGTRVMLVVIHVTVAVALLPMSRFSASGRHGAESGT